MRLLLDTHCWLWMQVSPERFSPESLDLLGDRENGLLLSAASSWEIGIKWALGKLALPAPPEVYVPKRMQRQGVAELPIEHLHALRAAALPPRHRDPFDRLLIAQALAENLTLLTADKQLAAYEGVAIRWA